jgi:hypothetical protein
MLAQQLPKHNTYAVNCHLVDGKPAFWAVLHARWEHLLSNIERDGTLHSGMHQMLLGVRQVRVKLVQATFCCTVCMLSIALACGCQHISVLMLCNIPDIAPSIGCVLWMCGLARAHDLRNATLVLHDECLPTSACLSALCLL